MNRFVYTCVSLCWGVAITAACDTRRSPLRRTCTCSTASRSVRCLRRWCGAAGAWRQEAHILKFQKTQTVCSSAALLPQAAVEHSGWQVRALLVVGAGGRDRSAHAPRAASLRPASVVCFVVRAVSARAVAAHKHAWRNLLCLVSTQAPRWHRLARAPVAIRVKARRLVGDRIAGGRSGV